MYILTDNQNFDLRIIDYGMVDKHQYKNRLRGDVILRNVKTDHWIIAFRYFANIKDLTILSTDNIPDSDNIMANDGFPSSAINIFNWQTRTRNDKILQIKLISYLKNTILNMLRNTYNNGQEEKITVNGQKIYDLLTAQWYQVKQLSANNINIKKQQVIVAS